MRDFGPLILRLGLTGALATSVIPHGALASPQNAPRPAATPRARRIALPFIADDFGRALGEARAKHRPILIEAWAPW